MRRALLAITALILIAGQTQDAFGQCSITVIDLNGTPTLCSDFGDDWRWTGPNGFTSSNMCVDAVAPGTYTLTAYDSATDTWSAPCSHTVGDPPPVPSCGITGPDSVCAGASVTWCAPSGDFTFVWNGPNGFSSSASCITVSEAGAYTLTVTDRTWGTTSEPCSQTLRVVDCSVPTPPLVQCPAPARWWSSVCASTGAPLAPGQADHVARSVDERSGVWNYGGTRAGLTEILAPARNGRMFHAARRHYAAVVANLVAHDMNLVDASGRAIGLSPDMLLDRVQGVEPGTTLASWVAATEATLLAVGEVGSRDRAGREKCRRIRLQAREINGANGAGCEALNSSLFADDDDVDTEGFGSAVILNNGGSSSPFANSGGMRWTLDRAESVELDVIDISGRHVKVFARGTWAAGTHDLAWDGRDDDGKVLRPGAYFLLGRIGEARMSQRLILIR